MFSKKVRLPLNSAADLGPRSVGGVIFIKPVGVKGDVS